MSIILYMNSKTRNHNHKIQCLVVISYRCSHRDDQHKLLPYALLKFQYSFHCMYVHQHCDCHDIAIVDSISIMYPIVN